MSKVDELLKKDLMDAVAKSLNGMQVQAIQELIAKAEKADTLEADYEALKDINRDLHQRVKDTDRELDLAEAVAKEYEERKEDLAKRENDLEITLLKKDLDLAHSYSNFAVGTLDKVLKVPTVVSEIQDHISASVTSDNNGYMQVGPVVPVTKKTSTTTEMKDPADQQ